VVVLTESGHMGFVEEEEKSLQIIKEFVNSIS
jgi:hypothetical protein